MINVSKLKLSMDIQKPKLVGISSIFNINKQVLPISILTSKLDKSVINITIIGANVYYVASKLKRAQVFAVSVGNLEF